MATIENNGLMVYLDSTGNKNILYPITKVDLVDGLDEHVSAQQAAAIADAKAAGTAAQTNLTNHTSSKSNPHGVTAVQAGALPAVEGTTANCYYRTVNGKQEWINPAMGSGIEYCTAERFDAKPVYRKRLSFQLSADTKTDFAFNHGISNFKEMVRCFVKTGTSAPLNVAIPRSKDGYITYLKDVTTTQIRFGNDGLQWGASYYWAVDLYYTKTTD